MSCDVAHPPARQSHGPEATVRHRARPGRHRKIVPTPGSDVATSPRPYAMSLATLLVGRGRAITKESSMSPPLWAPVSLVRCCDVAQAVCDVARSPRARGRSGDVAQAFGDVARDVAGAMWRCRAMWPTHPRDILSGPRRTGDIAPALSDIATSHPRSWQTSTRDIAPPSGRHRNIANARIKHYLSSSSSSSSGKSSSSSTSSSSSSSSSSCCCSSSSRC